MSRHRDKTLLFNYVRFICSFIFLLYLCWSFTNLMTEKMRINQQIELAKLQHQREISAKVESQASAIPENPIVEGKGVDVEDVIFLEENNLRRRSVAGAKSGGNDTVAEKESKLADEEEDLCANRECNIALDNLMIGRKKNPQNSQSNNQESEENKDSSDTIYGENDTTAENESDDLFEDLCADGGCYSSLGKIIDRRKKEPQNSETNNQESEKDEPSSHAISGGNDTVAENEYGFWEDEEPAVFRIVGDMKQKFPRNSKSEIRKSDEHNLEVPDIERRVQESPIEKIPLVEEKHLRFEKSFFTNLTESESPCFGEKIRITRTVALCIPKYKTGDFKRFYQLERGDPKMSVNRENSDNEDVLEENAEESETPHFIPEFEESELPEKSDQNDDEQIFEEEAISASEEGSDNHPDAEETDNNCIDGSARDRFRFAKPEYFDDLDNLWIFDPKTDADLGKVPIFFEDGQNLEEEAATPEFEEDLDGDDYEEFFGDVSWDSESEMNEDAVDQFDNQESAFFEGNQNDDEHFIEEEQESFPELPSEFPPSFNIHGIYTGNQKSVRGIPRVRDIEMDKKQAIYDAEIEYLKFKFENSVKKFYEEMKEFNSDSWELAARFSETFVRHSLTSQITKAYIEIRKIHEDLFGEHY